MAQQSDQQQKIELGEITIIEDDGGDGIFVKYDGETRSIISPELKKLAQENGPVEIR